MQRTRNIISRKNTTYDESYTTMHLSVVTNQYQENESWNHPDV